MNECNKKNSLLLGANLSIAGGLYKALESASKKNYTALQIFTKKLLYIFIVSLFQAISVSAFDYDLSFEILGELNSENNYLFEDQDEVMNALYDNIYYDNSKFIINDNFAIFGKELLHNSISIYPYLNFSTRNDLKWYIAGDLSFTHYSDEDYDNQLNIKLAHAYVFKKQNNISVNAGLQPFTIGNGYILYNEEPGIDLRYRISRRYYTNLQTAIVFKKSPLISVDLEYRRSIFEKFAIFGSFLRDENSKISEMINTNYFINNPENSVLRQYLLLIKKGAVPNLGGRFNYIINRLNSDSDEKNIMVPECISNTSDIFWSGVTANFFIGPIYFTGTSIFQFGTMALTLETDIFRTSSDNVVTNTTVTKIDISAYLADIELNYKINDTLAIGAFCFISSGDSDPQHGTFTEFFAPMPYNSRAPVFFNGFGYQDTPETISLPGIFRHGVFAPGIKIELNKNEKLFIEINLTGLYPEKNPSDLNSDSYGWETDISLSYEIKRNWHLYMEAGYFIHGDYFEKDGTSPDAASKINATIITIF